ALRSLVNLYQKFLEVNLHVAIADVCFTANTGRSHFEHRLAVVAESNIQLRERLLAFADSKEAIGIVSGHIDGKKHSKIAFLFTGQGSQYVDMGRQLYETQPIFRQALELCDKILCPYLGTSLLKIIYPNTKSKDLELDKTAYTQPALFALEYALCQLWKSWGVEPAAVMGHSVGEYVAACVAGVFSLEDGLKLIAERARLMQALPENGEMVAVMAGSDLVNSLIKDKTKQVAIAALNGPNSIVISGATPAIREICAQLNDKRIKFKKLEVSHAFHSPLMQPILTDFEVIANQVTYNRPQIPLISNVTGTRVDDTICTPQYWLNHILQPVRFVDSITCLNQHDHNIIYLEIGPKPVLLGIGCQCLPENMGLWLPSLRSPQTDWQQMLQSLALLYINGVSVDWKGFDKDYNYQKVALPTYPFERKRYWLPETIVDHNINTKEFSQTSIIKLLHQGDTQGLAQRLAGELDESLRRDLPQILSVLVKCHQQEINSTLIKDWFYQVEWQPNILHKLLDATVSDRQYELLSYLQSKIAKILNLANIEELNLHQPLNDMGFDSLMAVELRNWVQASFNVEVSIVKFMDKLSTLDLVAYISEQITNIKLTSEESVLIAQQLQTAPTNQQLENREEIEL
ncbi:acyltransferase domain-containing protein, partial [Anabaena catenula]